MKHVNKKILILILLLSGVSFGAFWSQKWKWEQMTSLSQEEVAGLVSISNPDALGAVPQRPSFYKTRLARSLAQGSDSTTIYVTSLSTADSQTLSASDFGDRIDLVINPTSSSGREIISCTGTNSTDVAFTGCSRGFTFYSSATNTTRMVAHSPGETIIVSNTDQYQSAQYVSIDDAQTITGLKTFSNYPVFTNSTNATTSLQFVTLGQVNNIAISGASTSTESLTGIVQLATQLEMASSSPFDTQNPTVLQSRYATATPYTSGRFIPISDRNGQLHSNWFTLGSASTTFYGLLASSTNISNIGWWGSAFRDIFASGTIFGNSLSLSTGFVASSTNPVYWTASSSITGAGSCCSNEITGYDETIPSSKFALGTVIRIKANGTAINNGGVTSTSSVRVLLGDTQVFRRDNSVLASTEVGNLWELESTINIRDSLSSQYIFNRFSTSTAIASGQIPETGGINHATSSAAVNMNNATRLRVLLGEGSGMDNYLEGITVEILKR